jgi:glycosyltransferase involved in cell wall biosynthesis
MMRGRKPRLILAVKTLNRISYLRQCLATWMSTANTADFEWKIVVADDGSTDGTLQYLETFSSAALTLIRNRRRYAVGQFNSILEQIVGERYDVCFMADDDVLFLYRGWEQSYLTGIERSGHHHLCWFDRDYWHLAWPLRSLPDGRVNATGTCAGSVRVQDCLGAFFTVTPQVVETVGYADEVNFPVRGQWHVDYSMRCVRAGWNEAFPFYDAIDGHRRVSVQDLHRRRYTRSIPDDSFGFRCVARTETLTQRAEIMARPDRIYLPLQRVVQTRQDEGGPTAFR